MGESIAVLCRLVYWARTGIDVMEWWRGGVDRVKSYGCVNSRCLEIRGCFCFLFHFKHLITYMETPYGHL